MSASVLLSLSDRLDRISTTLGRATAWLGLALVLVTFMVVVLRYLLDSGSIAMQESALYLHATLFMLGAAWTLKIDGHVRVDVLYRHFSARGKAAADLFGTLVFLLPTCTFLLWISLDYVEAAWRVREASPEAGGLPFVYLLKTLIPATGFLLIVQGISQLLRRLGELLQPGELPHG
ncbi:TRAP-type mannitol/chloroaromatic compound transport system permease small subunit [Thiogranum longum]|uniref:TRAP transporter small permease protein n=1 Tax=Thiogranum longum TaxID=1537524 RepID=A0A4R1H9X1_9GAMM|nr:TRAP transporter small permease subunit [Thiogranum longum]TCK16945.1 TRAP-type mannitol/chloroaromatic compound transport system permease small subunit [Thiogranum longum]